MSLKNKEKKIITQVTELLSDTSKWHNVSSCYSDAGFRVELNHFIYKKKDAQTSLDVSESEYYYDYYVPATLYDIFVLNVTQHEFFPTDEKLESPFGSIVITMTNRETGLKIGEPVILSYLTYADEYKKARSLIADMCIAHPPPKK